MNYSQLRSKCSSRSFVDGLYVELRGTSNDATISGFFNVFPLNNDSTNTDDYIKFFLDSRKERIEILSLLKNLSEVYYIFCDIDGLEFKVVKDLSDYSVKDITESEYIQLIYSLPNTQLTGKHSLPPKYPDSMPKYSVWHYSLDWVCKCRDIDYIEINDGRPVALLEVTGKLNDERHLSNSLERIKERMSLQKKLLMLVSDFLKINAFFVVHTIDLSIFYIFDINFNKIKRCNQNEYIDWLEQL